MSGRLRPVVRLGDARVGKGRMERARGRRSWKESEGRVGGGRGRDGIWRKRMMRLFLLCTVGRRVALDFLEIFWVMYGDGFGVFVLGMMFFCVNFFVFLEILRTLESLVAYFACMRLERGVNSEVRSDVVTLCAGGPAVLPSTSKTEVVGALSADVVVAKMIVERLWIGK